MRATSRTLSTVARMTDDEHWESRPAPTPPQPRAPIPIGPIAMAVVVAGLLGALVITSPLGDAPSGPSSVAPSNAMPTDAPALNETRTAIGPLSVPLPVTLEGWEPVPGVLLEPQKSAWEAAGQEVAGLWSYKSSTASGAQVTVAVRPAGSHGGLSSVLTSIDTSNLAEPLAADTWAGTQPYRAVQLIKADGTKTVALFIEASDGSLIAATASAPAQLFDSSGLGVALLDAALLG